MCWCCRIIGQRMCYLCDSLLTGTICLGGLSTATTTTLQYTGHIDDWRAIVIPSIATFVAIIGCVLRCICRAQTQVSINKNRQHSTIIINTREFTNAHQETPPVEPEKTTRLPAAIAIPVGAIEMTSSQEALKSKRLTEIRDEWRRSQQDII